MNVEWCRAAAYVLCLNTAGEVLLTRFEQLGNPDSGSWTLPGGGVEWGEDVAETAMRELAEETGLTAELGPILGVQSVWFEAEQSLHGKPGLALGVVFEASQPVGELRQEFPADDSTVEAAWFGLDKVHSLQRVPLIDFALALAEGQGR